MPKSLKEDVVFGLGGAWGFARDDLTSPERAARAGAFTDSTPPVAAAAFTELRVHGVSGSDGPTMLEHPAALQVAGDTTTMFYRRWSPAGSGGAGVPWKLEAYSWGGLTEAPLASASWLLFAPFMLYNVAHFALPPAQQYEIEQAEQPSADPQVGGDAEPPPEAAEGHPAQLLSRDWWHARAQVVLRLLAFSATVQFIAAIVSILVNTIAVQAGNAHFPSWLSWYPQLPTGDRVTLAMIGVAAVIAVMWLISVRTAQRYEARTGPAGGQPPVAAHADRFLEGSAAGPAAPQPARRRRRRRDRAYRRAARGQHERRPRDGAGSGRAGAGPGPGQPVPAAGRPAGGDAGCRAAA